MDQLMSKSHGPAAGWWAAAGPTVMGHPMMRGKFTPGPWTSAVQGPKYLKKIFGQKFRPGDAVYGGLGGDSRA